MMPIATLGEHKTLRAAQTDFRREFIRMALTAAGGNRTVAAKRLGIERTRLQALLKVLDIGVPPRFRRRTIPPLGESGMA